MKVKIKWPLLLDKKLRQLKLKRLYYALLEGGLVRVVYLMKTTSGYFLIAISYEDKDKGFGTIEILDSHFRRLYQKAFVVIDDKTFSSIILRLGARKKIDVETLRQVAEILHKRGYIKRLPSENELLKVLSMLKRLGIVKDSRIDILLQRVINVVWFIFLVFALSSLIIAIVNKVKVEVEERKANLVQRRLMEALFSGQTGKEKEFYEVYGTLLVYLDELINSKKLNGLLVCGPPGTGKSYVIQRYFYFKQKTENQKFKYKYMRGAVDDAWSFYMLLYKYKDYVLVLDDFDIQWSDEVIALIKAATDTYPERVISYPTFERTSSAGQNVEMKTVPDKFVFTGKLILVTNKDKYKIPLSIKSRMLCIEIAFNIAQMLEVIRKMLKYIAPTIPMTIKEEIFNYLLELHKKGKLKRLDYRIFEAALITRVLAKRDDWKKRILEIVSE